MTKRGCVHLVHPQDRAGLTHHSKVCLRSIPPSEQAATEQAATEPTGHLRARTAPPSRATGHGENHLPKATYEALVSWEGGFRLDFQRSFQTLRFYSNAQQTPNFSVMNGLHHIIYYFLFTCVCNPLCSCFCFRCKANSSRALAKRWTSFLPPREQHSSEPTVVI